jgi:hypothetical protein
VVISSLRGKTIRVVERPVITHFTSSFSLLYNYTAHETMDFTFKLYHKVVIIIVQCIKGKTLSLAHVQHNYYSGSNILTHLWSISISWQYTCVAHAFKFFSIRMCTLQWIPTVSNRICVYKYLNRVTLAVVTLCTDMASTLVGITDRTYWTLWRWCPAKLLLLQHVTL